MPTSPSAMALSAELLQQGVVVRHSYQTETLRCFECRWTSMPQLEQVLRQSVAAEEADTGPQVAIYRHIATMPDCAPLSTFWPGIMAMMASG